MREKSLQDLKLEYYFAWGMLGIGVLMMAVGVFFGERSIRLAQGGSHTEGLVVAHHTELQRVDNNSRMVISPEIEFVDALGVSHQFTSQYSIQDNTEFAVGTTAEVVYLQDDPTIAEINHFETLWLWPALGLGIGSMFVIGCLIAIRSFRYKIAQREE